MKPADGLGEERLLTDQPGTPSSWSKDGRYLLFTSGWSKTLADIWVLSNPGDAEAKPGPVLVTEFAEQQGQFSPDGRWIAYYSNESSVAEIYVRPFAPGGSSGAGGAKYLVSRGFSIDPRWQGDGARLFYVSATTLDLMAVDIDTSRGFQAGTPERLFTAPRPLLPTGWSLAPSGDRFVFVATPDGGKPAPFTVVLNWAAALAR
jgi:Tol biopolymer transport system component